MRALAPVLILLALPACGGGEGTPDAAAAPDAPGEPDAVLPIDAGIDVIGPECTIQGGHMGPPIVTGFTPDHVCRGAKVVVAGEELAGGCAMMAFRSMFVGVEEGDLVTSFRIPGDMIATNDVFVVHTELGTSMSPFVLTIGPGHIPILTGIAPGQAMADDSVTVSGSNLAGAAVELSNDSLTAPASVTQSADDSLTFTVPAVPIGFYDVTVSVPDCGFAVSLNGVQVI